MSGKVIHLDEKRDSGPYLSAWAECGACSHGWQAVTPVGVIHGLECPSCLMQAGKVATEIEPDEGVEIFVCPCGGETYFGLRSGLMCEKCGVVHPYARIADHD